MSPKGVYQKADVPFNPDCFAGDKDDHLVALILRRDDLMRTSIAGERFYGETSRMEWHMVIQLSRLYMLNGYSHPTPKY